MGLRPDREAGLELGLEQAETNARLRRNPDPAAGSWPVVEQRRSSCRCVPCSTRCGVHRRQGPVPGRAGPRTTPACSPATVMPALSLFRSASRKSMRVCEKVVDAHPRDPARDEELRSAASNVPPRGQGPQRRRVVLAGDAMAAGQGRREGDAVGAVGEAGREAGGDVHRRDASAAWRVDPVDDGLDGGHILGAEVHREACCRCRG